MNVEKFCLKCLHEIAWDTTEHYWCCECFAVHNTLDEDYMPCLEYSPDFWINTDAIPRTKEKFAIAIEALKIIALSYKQRIDAKDIRPYEFAQDTLIKLGETL